MPVVSRSDCTEVIVNEQYEFKFSIGDGNNGNNSKSITITGTEVEFQQCTNNDLRTRFDELTNDGLVTPEAKAIFDKQVPESGCSDDTYNDFLSTFGYKLK